MVAAAMLPLGAACSDGDGGDGAQGSDTTADEAEGSSADATDRSPEETVSDFVDAEIAGDCDRIQDLATESFWTERGALEPDEAADGCRERLERGLTSPEDIRVDDIALVDDTESEAVVLLTGTDGGQRWATEFIVVQDDGEWRVHWIERR